MLQAKHRISKDTEFRLVRSKGKRKVTKGFTFYFLKTDSETTRFGFVVSKKVGKHASIRNRVKRAFREACRQSIYYIKPGYDCVFVVKPTAARWVTSEIMSEVKRVLQKNLYD